MGVCGRSRSQPLPDAMADRGSPVGIGRFRRRIGDGQHDRIGPATAAGTGNAGSSSNPGTAGGGNTSPTGTGGTGAPSVQHARPHRDAASTTASIRLSNTQWARAVQTVLNVPSGGLEANFETPVTGMTDFTNNELVLDVDARNWSDFQTAAETLAAQVTATDAALAKVYSGTDAAGFITTLGRRVYRRPLTTAEQSTYMTLYNTGSSLIGVAQRVREGRVAGDPRDAAVAVLPVPDRARARTARRSTATRWRRSCRCGCAGRRPDDETARFGGRHRQARHRRRRRGAGDDDAGRGDRHRGDAAVPRRAAALRRASP